MALRFMDGFDHYVAGSIGAKWTVNQNLTGFNTGRFGGTALELAEGQSGTTTRRAVKVFDSAKSTWIFGLAWLKNVALTNETTSILVLGDASNNHMVWGIENGTDRLYVTVPAGTYNILNPALGGIWYYIECKIVIHDTTGSLQIKVNGSTVVNQTNIDTKAGTSTTADRFDVRGNVGNGTLNWRMDDFYVCDGDGGAPWNDFLGDVRVETLFPNGNGNSSQFDGSDGNQVDNYLLVDDPTHDGDTTYVESPDPGDKDTYAYGDLATPTGTVYGVQINPLMRKSTAGSRTAVTVARLSGTEEDSAVKVVFDNYLWLSDVRPTKPGGGSWTISDVNNAEFGLKVNS